jgi:hypothetical protein
LLAFAAAKHGKPNSPPTGNSGTYINYALDRIGTGENHTFVTLDLLQRFQDPDGDKMIAILLKQPELGTLTNLTTEEPGRKVMYRYTVNGDAPASAGWDTMTVTVSSSWAYSSLQCVCCICMLHAMLSCSRHVTTGWCLQAVRCGICNTHGAAASEAPALHDNYLLPEAAQPNWMQPQHA